MLVQEMDNYCVYRAGNRDFSEYQGRSFFLSLDLTKCAVIDLVDVEYIDSSALTFLIRCMKRLLANKCLLVICNVDPKVMHIIELVSLSKLFNICKDVESAVEFIKSKGCGNK